MCPGTFITPSGLATMGFGPAAALGVKVAQPKRHAIALIGDGGFSANPSVIATAMEAGLPRDLGGDGQLGVRHDRRSRGDALRHDASAACSSATASRIASTTRRWRDRSAPTAYMVTAADKLGPALAAALASGRPIADPGADGKRPDADAGALGHQRHLSSGE